MYFGKQTSLFSSTVMVLLFLLTGSVIQNRIQEEAAAFKTGILADVSTTALQPALVTTILYVDQSNGTPGNGSSWALSFDKLQDALDEACNNATVADPYQIWVAEGLYFPDEGITETDDDRSSTFQLCDNVAMYGGFLGIGTNETLLSQRNFVANQTILSGDLKQDDGQFSLVVRAKSDALLSELMSIGSRYTAAEAYGTTGQQLDVQLTFGDDAVANAGFELYQNTPNPFVGETQIGFNLPNASDVTITINDVTGRTLKVIRGEFAKGYNTVNVNNLPSGVMYYTLESGDFTATLKMINIK